MSGQVETKGEGGGEGWGRWWEVQSITYELVQGASANYIYRLSTEGIEKIVINVYTIKEAMMLGGH